LAQCEAGQIISGTAVEQRGRIIKTVTGVVIIIHI
jgi:hypothetical protein